MIIVTSSVTARHETFGGHRRRRAAGHLIIPPAAEPPSGQGAAAGPIQSDEDAGAALTLAAVHESVADAVGGSSPARERHGSLVC